MSPMVKRSLGALVVVASVVVAGLAAKGMIPAELAATLQAILAGFAYASPSPVVRTGQ